jgi:membrane protease YdiL (CAAX protease family)
MPRPAAVIAMAAFWAGSPVPPRAQDVPRAADSTARARGGAQFLIPLGSLFVPGLGQYIHGAPVTGAAFTATAVGGYALYFTGDTAVVREVDLPRHAEGQQAFIGLQLAGGAGGVSAYDAFRRALPALRRDGKYGFVTSPAATGALLTAPFDPEFLTRWTTWIELAYTGALAFIVLNERDPGVAYEPYKARDAAFLTGVSLTAGVGEEAMFRGWLLPVLHQNTGGRFWLSNGIQAAVFGGLHLPQAKEFAAVIAAWAVYEGWLTRRNGWDIRESIFHHFWYDAIVGTAIFLADERGPGLVVRFPTISF